MGKAWQHGRGAKAASLVGLAGAAPSLSIDQALAIVIAAIMAGDADKSVSHRQAQRLHGDVAGSRLDIWRGASHMIHHDDPSRFVRGIEVAAEQANVGVAAELI